MKVSGQLYATAGNPFPPPLLFTQTKLSRSAFKGINMLANALDIHTRYFTSSFLLSETRRFGNWRCFHLQVKQLKCAPLCSLD